MVGDPERPTEAVAALFLDDSDPAMVPEARFGPGSTINGYTVDELIGTGATGLVYSATHPVIGKRVAIKVLREELCDDAETIERFVMEARAVNAINHPNIIDIFDIGTLADRRRYLIMDLLIGRTLRRRLGDGPLHVSEAAAVIDDCASALIAAHDKGFIHRDLKPDNVFLAEVAGRRRPEVRLLDFGVVKLVAGNNPAGGGVRTRAGIVIGTPAYMSPEQAVAKQVDSRTDIYALGVMSFELLVGRRPYKHPSVLELLLLHAQAPIPSLRDEVPSIPIEVAQLVEAMLAKQPEDRPTLSAVRTVIKRLVGSVIPTVTEAHAQLAVAAGAESKVIEILRADDSGPATMGDRPGRLGSTPPEAPSPSAGGAMLEMSVAGSPATVDPPPVSSGAITRPTPTPSLPRMLPKGTPSKTQQVQEVSIEDELDAPHAAAGASGLWLLFAIAAVAIAAGGVLLGMSL